MYALKPQFEYARPDKTGRFHLKRLITKGTKQGTYTGCKHGATSDSGTLESLLLGLLQGFTWDIVLFDENNVPPLPQDFLDMGGKPSTRPKSRKRTGAVFESSPPKKPRTEGPVWTLSCWGRWNACFKEDFC